MRDIAIVYFNTLELTTALVKSILKFSPGNRIIIFDNSDRIPFPEMEGVIVLDNTKGQLVDFEAMKARYPNSRETAYYQASAKHIASVDYLFDVCPNGFMLMDSDILLKKDINPLFDDAVAWTGMREDPPNWFSMERLAPYLLWINVPLCRKHGVRFWHERKVYKLSHDGAPFYDTGASFYEDCNKAGLEGRKINIYEYIIHFGSASYTGIRADMYKFLNNNKHLFEDMTETKTKVKAAPKKPAAPKAEKKDDRVLVVIPYCSQGAQGRELEFAVAGWRKHFKENYLIVLAGEDHPITKTGDDIVCIESERVPEKAGQYRQHLDYVSCLRKVRAAFPDSKGFIMVADDCYAVNDFDLIDVKFLKQRDDDMGGDLLSSNMWQRDKAKTKALLIKEGYPTRNFTTHLPQYYEWDKLSALWDKYDMDNQSYLMEDLYYNIYFPTRIPLQLHIDHDNLKCGVYRSNPRLNYIDRAFKKQIWITNSPVGWIPALVERLQNYYGI